MIGIIARARRDAQRLIDLRWPAASTVLVNGFANSSSALVNALLAVLLVPWLFSAFGAELYGLWISAASIATLCGCLGFGLRWSLIRVIASANGELTNADTVSFVKSAATVLCLAGTLGAVLIAVCGIGIASGIVALSDDAARVVPPVFALSGLAFVGDMLAWHPGGILQGLQRFVSLNVVLTSSSVARWIGIAIILKYSQSPTSSLLAVAQWSAGISIVTFLALHFVVRHVAPDLRVTPGRLVWREVQPHVRFGLTSQLNSIAGWTLWHSGTWVANFILGPSSVAIYAIGQRLPLATQILYWRNADVLFPYAAQHRHDNRATSTLLQVVTLVNLLLALPICAVCVTFAPDVLRLWLGQTSTEAAWVMRFTGFAVLADALGAAASQVVWGRGEATAYLRAYGGATILTVMLTILVAGTYGVVGVAAALAAGISALAVTFLVLVVRTLHTPHCG